MTQSTTAATSGLMAGKKGLILGVANNRSIAWGIAKACADHGALMGFTYQGDALKKRCLLYTSPSPRDLSTSRMPSSA